MNDYTLGQGFGIAPVTGWPKPQIRVIGRNVYINGTFLIPLAENGVSTNLRTVASEYQIPYNVDTETYTGSDGGFSTASAGSILSNSPIIPSVLAPSITNAFGRNITGTRVVRDTAGVKSVVYDAIFNNAIMLTDGKLLMVTHADIDDFTGAGTAIPNSAYHSFITKASSGEYVLDYAAYKTSFTGTGPGTDNRVVTAHPTSTYPSDVNGEDQTMLGGYFFHLDLIYPVDLAYDENDIRNAFDSI